MVAHLKSISISLPLAPPPHLLSPCPPSTTSHLPRCRGSWGGEQGIRPEEASRQREQQLRWLVLASEPQEARLDSGSPCSSSPNSGCSCLWDSQQGGQKEAGGLSRQIAGADPADKETGNPSTFLFPWSCPRTQLRRAGLDHTAVGTYPDPRHPECLLKLETLLGKLLQPSLKML